MARFASRFASRRRALTLLGSGLLMLGTACAPKAYAERTASSFDLESSQTYAWITDDHVLIEFGTDQSDVRTKANEERIRVAIDRELAARGFAAVPRAEAQLLVAFSVGVDIRYRLEGGESTAVTVDGPGKPQTKGTLNIYLLDPVQQDQVWHGWMSKWLSPNDDPDTVIDMAVKKIMSTYPNSTP